MEMVGLLLLMKIEINSLKIRSPDINFDICSEIIGVRQIILVVFMRSNTCEVNKSS